MEEKSSDEIQNVPPYTYKLKVRLNDEDKGIRQSPDTWPAVRTHGCDDTVQVWPDL